MILKYIDIFEIQIVCIAIWEKNPTRRNLLAKYPNWFKSIFSGEPSGSFWVSRQQSTLCNCKYANPHSSRAEHDLSDSTAISSCFHHPILVLWPLLHPGQIWGPCVAASAPGNCCQRHLHSTREDAWFLPRHYLNRNFCSTSFNSPSVQSALLSRTLSAVSWLRQAQPPCRC